MSASHRLLTLATAMALTGIGGFSGQAAASATNLSTTPPDLTTSVAPNIAVTFDDSGSMQSYYMGDNRPFDQKGWSTTSPWMCAGVIDPRIKDTKNNASKPMNGVYYNPNVAYATAVNANGTPMPNADATLQAVWLNGIDINRPDNRQTAQAAAFLSNRNSLADYNDARVSNLTGTIRTTDKDGNVTQNDRWGCTAGATNPFDGTLKDPDTGATPTGGPYYWRLKSGVNITNSDGTVNASTSALYKASNWEAVSVPASQYQNFANWFAYYRTRNMMTRTALSQAFSKIGNSVRIAWQNMANANGNSTDGTKANADYDTKFGSTAVLQDIGDLNSPVRASFYRWMLQVVGGNSTPARAATIRASDVFRQPLTKDKNDPYWNGQTASSDSADLVCRKNFHMLVTDGYWNEGDPSLPAAVNGTPALTDANSAVQSQTLPDARSYSPGDSFSKIYGNVAGDLYTSSMANIAWFYWATDLQPTLTNGVKPYWKDLTASTPVVVTNPGANDTVYWNPVNDPAIWQHVSQFFVTLGVAGTLDYPGDYPALLAGTKSWPRPVNNSPEGVDDTWHAAINSRGGFFNASDPTTLVSSLVNIINSVIATSSSAVAPALSAGVLGPNALTYVPNFSSVDWSGTLTEYPLTSTGGRGTSDWEVSTLLKGRTNRAIVTSAGPGEGNGVEFLYTNLTSSQKQIMDSSDGSATTASSDVKGTNRVNWVRGVQTDEGSLLRTRASVFGAVVNAQPLYVAYPSSGYRDFFPPDPTKPTVQSPETAAYNGSTPDPTKSYSAFVAANINRMPTIYVAANDGMLHAFDAQSKAQSTTAGSELWSYVPDAVYRKLWFFSQKDNFKYRPTVDSTPIVRDVYFSQNAKSAVGWHTILVGGLRYGGRGIYALDVTKSGTTDAAGASKKVLWEFNANSLNDNGTANIGSNLGYTFGQPNIGRLSTGQWVVLVPAGYFPTDSTDPEYGAAAASATNSSLFILDAQTGKLIKELKTPTSYGGVTTPSYGLSSPVLGDYDNDQIDDVAFAGDLVGNLWRFNLSDLNTVDLMFRPTTNEEQPITVMPRLFPDPNSQNFIVVFGTGKFIGDDDRTSTGAKTQSVYGIRDLGQTVKTGLPWTKDKLVQQILDQTSTGLRGLTTNAAPTSSKPGGWYFDLISPGEKVVVTPTALFNTNRAIITTLIPTTPDPCNPGRAGAIMVVDSSTGGAGAGVSGGSYPAGSPYTVAGSRVDNPPATGGLPAATGLGGGSVIVPGVTVTGSGGTSFSAGSPIWRRRSWRILNDQ
jgi:type IV pilus assembly protein PilY1